MAFILQYWLCKSKRGKSCSSELYTTLTTCVSVWTRKTRLFVRSWLVCIYKCPMFPNSNTSGCNSLKAPLRKLLLHSVYTLETCRQDHNSFCQVFSCLIHSALWLSRGRDLNSRFSLCIPMGATYWLYNTPQQPCKDIRGDKRQWGQSSGGSVIK